MSMFDGYISSYVTDASGIEYEVTFGFIHGEGQWSYWHDTGDEFDIVEEVKLFLREVISLEDGSLAEISKELVSKAEEKAGELYWDRVVDGYYQDIDWIEH